MASWVTVHTTNDEAEVNLVKGILEEYGINCIIESSKHSPWITAPLFNQFELKVLKEKLEEAKEIIKTAGD